MIKKIKKKILRIVIKIILTTSNFIFKKFDLIVLNKRITNRKGYELLLPTANYAPWLIDKEFINIYEKIKPYTLVDIYRCYELWQLVEESAKSAGALIEIGVWKGGTGSLIAKKASLLNLKETVYLCDTFDGVVKVDPKFDSTYIGGEHNDTSKKLVLNLTENIIKLNNVNILQGIFPEDTGVLIREDMFRFCHIDVDVYQSAKDILDWIWLRLSIGGIVVFDDYGIAYTDGVTKLVNEFKIMNDRVTLYNLNGHAIMIKLK